MARDERRDPGEMYPGGRTYGKPGEAPDRAVKWESVVDKPTTYPPEKHRHDTSEVDGLNDSLEQCVRKVEGKGLSTCDYTQAEKAKLSRVEDGANKTIIDASLSTSSAAADAKAVGDKIADCMTKVTTLKINDEWRFSLATGLSGGIAIRLEHLDFPLQGIWGIRTEMTIPTGLGTLSKSADVAAATKLTPVYGEWTFDVTIDQVNAALESYNAELVVDSLEVSFVDGTWSLHSNPVGFGGKANGFVADDIDATELYFPYNGYGLDVHATRAIIGYRLGTDENAPILIEADEKTDEETGKTIYELPDPIKSALFSGKGFKQAVKKAGGFQHDENGYYIEVEEA